MADSNGRGSIPVLEYVDAVRSALDLVTAGPDVTSRLDHDVILPILSLLYEKGMEDPQQLADAAFLLASSKLFTGML
ncbi:hypothetical protein [Pseudorhizobium marinum]|uniref:hypothetical protein n=1 Tax=Pseudorhizobium marinum TaxID=1496690 RepID=UPI0004975094|nr:hypothetical protein [Pseudorhizobium marinum]MDY6961121.1 hypothetical protein [Pseudomonadota bacterium]